MEFLQRNHYSFLLFFYFFAIYVDCLINVAESTSTTFNTTVKQNFTDPYVNVYLDELIRELSNRDLMKEKFIYE